MASPTVLIIGCGIAGPVVGLLLKQKGYHPIIFERASSPGDVGASIVVFPNGSKVLNLLDENGTMPTRLSETSDAIQEMFERTASGDVLGWTDVPTEFRRRFGAPATGAKRTDITTWLRELAVRQGVEIRDGWALEHIEEDVSSVTAHFKCGRESTTTVTETGAFLVGCDGIKSTVRRVLLARRGIEDGAPAFTGLTQINGFSPTPASFREHAPARNCWYGEGLHAMSYPVSKDMVSWALTAEDNQGEEAAWGLFDEEQRASMKTMLKERLAGQKWDPVVLELISSASRMVKYGIYDRPQLPVKQWYSGRSVMIGDAVHPASTHLGQGANQACEDCYHLTTLLPGYNDSSSISTEQLTLAFERYAEKQQPRTSLLAEGARTEGRMRVVPAEKCAERDEIVRRKMLDRHRIIAAYDFIFSGPF